MLLLALITFDAGDPSFNLVKTSAGVAHNKAGLFGAYASGFLNDIFGIGALLWPPVFAALGAACVSASWAIRWWRWCGFFLLTLCLLMAASSLDISIGDLSGGGMVGNALYLNGKRYLSPLGSFVLWFFIFLAGTQLACNISWINLAAKSRAWLKDKLRFDSLKKQKTEESGQPSPIARQSHFSSAWGKATAFIKDQFARLKASESKYAQMPDIKLSGAPDSDSAENIAPIIAPEKTVNAKIFSDPEDDEPFASSQELRDPYLGDNRDRPPLAITPDLSPAPLVANEEITPQPAVSPQSAPLAFKIEKEETATPPRAIYKPEKETPTVVPEKTEEAREAPLPSIELLKPAPPGNAVSREALQAKGQALMACFKDFDVHGELVRITPGPVVTMFEMRPAPGTRVSKIANLSDDLSRALKAVAVRIQAPIPGSDTVGIEIPNETRETVNFRELIESGEFSQGMGPLTMALGKNISGQPYMADLAKMPHLLVAGATGAGKSVCLNSILISLLYHSQPGEMRLLLVDPKRIEMAAYADLPHLVHPVVTEMSDAKNALDWAVHEMENRYKAVAKLGVRNVAAYNRKLEAFKDNLPPDFADLKRLPYLVIVIDELADLMMTAAREVETSIVRLAQLARAAGIHMILATQRPSVDVVTGLIKANFPCRISFQVTSKHDSRTILDQAGAEHLLGKGDMLYKPSGGRLQRLHGPFLSDEEVAAVVSHWKKYLSPAYNVDFSQWNADSNSASSSPGGDATSDALYADAKAFVMGQEKASISLLQRHLKIGFNRAARLMEQFEREGLLGPAVGSSPRNVIR